MSSDPGLQFQAVDAFGDLVESLALHHPLVVAVDDLQWADPSSLLTLGTLGGRLRHVHLSDNAGKGWDSHLPLDQGVLDLGRFLEALATRGFEGAISLEIDLRSHLDDEQALRRILSRNRELCESGLTLPA